MKRFIFIIVVALFITSCNNGVKKSEYDKLKTELAECNAELTECKKTVEELQNTPQVRLSKGQQFLSENNITNAKKEFNDLIAKFGESDEAQKAKSILADIEKKEKERKEAEERKRTLGFKILKESSSVNTGDVTIKFNSVTTGQQWVFDNYGSEWRYRSAERGDKYVLSRVAISSENKDPNLPPVAVYNIESGTLKLLGTMDYEFARWKDYGTYLGNYTDYGNDFAHTRTISFSLGLSVSNDILTNKAVFVVVKKENCFYRQYERFENPPVSYRSSGCNMKSSLTVDDFDNDYVLVKIFNKNKL
ncbi:MAG TPA: hypothetical protein GXZ87_10190 [Bacteroidales bacterium]|nr:hypothetical protein [Bacteroidales bacterium]